MEDNDALTSGANPELARRVSDAPGDVVYLAPANGGACTLSAIGLESECFSTANMLAGATATAIICAPGLPTDQVEVFGVLPDGAGNVNITRADGSSVTLPVVNNYYEYTARKDAPLPSRIGWEQSTTHHEVDSNVPLTQVQRSAPLSQRRHRRCICIRGPRLSPDPRSERVVGVPLRDSDHRRGPGSARNVRRRVARDAATNAHGPSGY